LSQLVISNNSAANPQTLDLTAYMMVNDGDGMDPANPDFTQKIWSHSLLKPGATLSLEQFVEKELVFPLLLGPIGGQNLSTISAVLQFIQQINSIVTTPGATAAWQPLGASQTTTFDLLSGQCDVDYSYRKESQAWTQATLRLFTAPLGRTAAPRRYAAASGVGPLLMITPYASGGAQTIGASTQAGVAGYGAGKQGGTPSGGVFYWGSPSLAGDAPASLQISYVGPLPNTATEQGCVPWTIVSILPDSLYRPLVTAAEIVQTAHGTTLSPGGGATEAVMTQSTAIASSYHRFTYNTGAGSQYSVTWAFNPLAQGSDVLQDPSVAWAGSHRVLAVARASSPVAAGPAQLSAAPGGLISVTQPVQVPNGLDWGLYDLGTFTMRPSQAPSLAVSVTGTANGSQSLDLGAFFMVPDNSSWFFPPTSLVQNASAYGIPSSWFPQNNLIFGVAPYTNSLLLDDVLGEQFVFQGASQSFAPSPIGSVPSAARITQYTRGLVPQPDPKNGLPIIAILSLAQSVASPWNVTNHLGAGVTMAGASWTNPQNLPTYARINVLEKFRYVAN